MPRGDKSSYTSKQKRQAEHIEEGYEKRGVGEKEAERRAWATVNKETGGGKKSGSGRGKEMDTSPSRKGGRLGGAARAAKASTGGAAKSTAKGSARSTGRAAAKTSSRGAGKTTTKKIAGSARKSAAKPRAAAKTTAGRLGRGATKGKRTASTRSSRSAKR